MSSHSNSYFQVENFIDLIMCSEEDLQKQQNFLYSPKTTTSLLQSHSPNDSLAHFDFEEIKTPPLKTYQKSRNQFATAQRNNTQNQNITYQRFQAESQSEYQDEFRGSKTKQKNSNSIKKIGRIILDNISEYYKSQVANSSLHEMITLLSHSRKGEPLEQYKKRDRFNTHHLRLLLSSQDRRLSHFNLLTTRKLLNKHLRKGVLRSDQIKQSSKIVYMNTMKCSALRCVNSKLAVRLQMSPEVK